METETAKAADDDAIVLHEVGERFSVHDEKTAAWVVRKVVEERMHRQRVEQWRDHEVTCSQRREAFLLHRFGEQLMHWTRRQLDQQHGSRRSLHLPSGIVGFRTEPTKVLVTDERQLVAWCQEHLPSAVKVVRSILKTEISTYIKQSGECPDGAEFGGGGEKFYIK